MNFNYYEVFYAVGKHKNLTKAALELYSSQPAVTRTIQNLEAQLGCRLFVRTKSGVEFTHEGQTLYDYVSVAYMNLLKGEDEIRHAVSVETGTIYIGASVTSLHEFLFEFLETFQRIHPKIKLKITTGSNNGTVENLKNGVVDIAFVSTPCNLTKELRAVTIKSFNDILIAGSRFKQLKDKPLQLSDLQNYPFVCLQKNMQLRQFLDGVFAQNNLVITPEIEADVSGLLTPMISKNLGLGFVPQGLAQGAIERNEVFKVPLNYEMPKRKICMVVDPKRPRTTASHEMFRMVLSSLPSTEIQKQG